MEDFWKRIDRHYNERKNNKKLVIDGMINDEQYNQSDKKILFVLKEVNDWTGKNDNDKYPFLELKNLFHKNGNYKGPNHLIWHNVARIAAGIFYYGKQMSEIDNGETLKDSLSKIAVVNLKKTSGHSASNPDEINAYAYYDRKFLFEQITHLNPNIIIAGGVFNSLLWVLNLEIKFSSEPPWNRPVFERNNKSWIIPYKHPAARMKKVEFYNNFFKLVKKDARLNKFLEKK